MVDIQMRPFGKDDEVDEVPDANNNDNNWKMIALGITLSIVILVALSLLFGNSRTKVRS